MQKPHQPPTLAIQVGNTRIKLAIFRDADPEEAVFLPMDDVASAVEKATVMYESIGAEADASVVVASVNPKISTALVNAIRDQLACDVYEIPTDMPVPIGTCLAPGAKPGIDRLLNAAAAWDKLRQACVVIDAGTCITVDFVDGEGVFHGGAIAPGLRMQLRALHEQTAALPAISFDGAFEPPAGTAWGADTREAMLRGVYHGARGLVWRLVEKYAEGYGAFPVVIATGGDAASLFSDDELVTQVVPDLVLRGVAIAARHALEPDAPENQHGAGGSTRAGFSLLPSQSELDADDVTPLRGHTRGDDHEHHDGCDYDHDRAHGRAAPADDDGEDAGH